MNITFIKATSPEAPAKYLADLITARLAAGQRVLWLLSGGSCISVAIAAAKLLAGRNLAGLTVSLIDERYGPPGHADSNWAQLLAAGFELPGALLYPVLPAADRATAADEFASFLAEQFEASDFVLGLLGIGPDGHTSGIKPHSPALTAPGLVAHYDWNDYQRITTTPAALAKLDEAVVYLVGASKWPQLDRLETVLPPADQPAQLLKTVLKLTIFTDRPES